MRRFAAFAGNLALLGAIIDANPRSALDTFSPPRRASCSSGGHARQRQRLKQTDDHDDGADDHVVQGRGEQRAIPKHERRNDLGSLASAPASVTEVHASQERRAHINMMNSSSDDENGEAAAIFSASSRMIDSGAAAATGSRPACTLPRDSPGGQPLRLTPSARWCPNVRELEPVQVLVAAD